MAELPADWQPGEPLPQGLHELPHDPTRPVQDGWAELAEDAGGETDRPASERAVGAMSGMIGTVESNFVATEAEKRLPYQVIELYFDDEGTMVFPQRGSDHRGLHVVQYSHATFGDGEDAAQETDMVVHTPPTHVTKGIDYEYKYRGGANLVMVQRADHSNQPVPVVSGEGAEYLEWLQGNLNRAVEGLTGSFGAAGEGVDDI